MIIVLWFTLYWKWMLLAASLVLGRHYYKVIQEARAENKAVRFKDIEVKQVVPVVVESNKNE